MNVLKSETPAVLHKILEIDVELEWLMTFENMFKKEIELLKQQKIELYENAIRQSANLKVPGYGAKEPAGNNGITTGLGGKSSNYVGRSG